MSRLSLGLKILIGVGLLGLAGSAVATGVALPSHANSNAVTNTSTVTTGEPTAGPSSSPAAQSSFGACVSANAKTASDNGGQGWNPTVGCTNANAGNDASGQSGTDTASTHANEHASTGLSTAGDAGANGASHANANGADNASAGADNAGSHP